MHKYAAKGVEGADGANAAGAYALAALDVNHQVGLGKRAIVKGLRLIYNTDVVVDKSWRPVDRPPRIKCPPRDLEGIIDIIRLRALLCENFLVSERFGGGGVGRSKSRAYPGPIKRQKN